MKRSIVDYIAEHAARSPDRVAIHHRDRKLSYGELVDAAARFRGALAARGIRPGDRVALVMSDSPNLVIAFLAIIGMGAIAVPCSTMLAPEGLS
jgi:acyl-CoA synthetase (AMP-forming)/AMP-acid ligase II